jgi:dCTP deaminase
VSVIPLIIDGSAATVVEKQTDFDVEGAAVLIRNLDRAQLTDTDTSNVSYDLRVGNKYRSHLEKDPREIRDEGTITLHPGSALIIETAEYVHLPRRMFGIIAPKVSLLQQGLSTTFSKVDPGYDGHLIITLFNLGQTTCELKKGQGFCAFSVIYVGEGAELYEQPAQQLKARVDQRLGDHIREWLEANHVGVMIVLIVTEIFLFLATVGLIIVTVIDLGRY